MIKFSILMPRNPTMTHEQFVVYHQQQHALLFMSIPAVKDNVRRYVQQHPVPLEGLDLPLVAVDGITELWFDDAQGIANVFTDPEYLRVIRPDEAKFCDLDGCTFSVTTENVVHDLTR